MEKDGFLVGSPIDATSIENRVAARRTLVKKVIIASFLLSITTILPVEPGCDPVPYGDYYLYRIVMLKLIL